MNSSLEKAQSLVIKIVSCTICTAACLFCWCFYLERAVANLLKTEISCEYYCSSPLNLNLMLFGILCYFYLPRFFFAFANRGLIYSFSKISLLYFKSFFLVNVALPSYTWGHFRYMKKSNNPYPGHSRNAL